MHLKYCILNSYKLLIAGSDFPIYFFCINVSLENGVFNVNDQVIFNEI